MVYHEINKNHLCFFLTFLEAKILEKEQFESFNELSQAKNEVFKKNLLLILQLLGKCFFELVFKMKFRSVDDIWQNKAKISFCHHTIANNSKNLTENKANYEKIMENNFIHNNKNETISTPPSKGKKEIKIINKIFNNMDSISKSEQKVPIDKTKNFLESFKKKKILNNRELIRSQTSLNDVLQTKKDNFKQQNPGNYLSFTKQKSNPQIFLVNQE